MLGDFCFLVTVSVDFCLSHVLTPLSLLGCSEGSVGLFLEGWKNGRWVGGKRGGTGEPGGQPDQPWEESQLLPTSISPSVQ